MRKPLLAVMAVSFLLIAACDKKKDDSAVPAAAGPRTEAAAVRAENSQPAVAEIDGNEFGAEEDPARFAIKECSYDPENPTAANDVTVIPVLDEGFSVAESVRAAVSFTYRWIVQDEEIAEAREARLEKHFFKKFDWIQCRVRGSYNGMQTPEFRAKVIRIQNSPPQLELRPAGEFSAPGEFTYQIVARDPDHDTLTYSLVAPTDLGIVLDPRSGLISWRIDEEQAKKTEPIEIKYAVSDPDGGRVESSITLRFASRQTDRP